ncbi:MAG: [Fe-Fe] hydrogenase large subunit C-terminal domain-containing protein [bacterium]
MVQNEKHAAIKVLADVCIGCSRCMKVCPTEAIRVTDGKAVLHAGWCIDCGKCYRVCPTHAISISDDDFQQIFDFKYRVLLVPMVFYAQFEGKIEREKVDQVLSDIGFSEICVVEQSADILSEEINEYVKNADDKPVISSYCPAIIRLIQVKFPALLDNIMLLLPPLELTAKFYKDKSKAKGYNTDEIGIFYLTPCIAKIAAIRTPLGGYVSPINGVINMDLIYNKVLFAYKNHRFGESKALVSKELSSKGMLWSTTGGEAMHISGRTLSIDGMSNSIEFLEKLEDEEVGEGIDFLELRICDESCAGGIMMQSNRFLIADYLRKNSANYPAEHGLVTDYKRYLGSAIKVNSVEPRSMIKYDVDLSKALEKMKRAKDLEKELPGIDCGACGAPSCEALATDIVRDDASMGNCVFMQMKYAKEKTLTPDDVVAIMKHIWGEEKF